MLDMIRLLHGECRVTNEELKKFKKGGFLVVFFCAFFVIVLLSTCNHVVYNSGTSLLSICYRFVSKM